MIYDLALALLWRKMMEAVALGLVAHIFSISAKVVVP